MSLGGSITRRKLYHKEVHSVGWLDFSQPLCFPGMPMGAHSNNRSVAMTISLKEEIKGMMVENLMLQMAKDEIGDEMPLFGPGGLGLDSVDALQMVVALDKKYGFKILNPETARVVLQNVASIAEAIEKHRQTTTS